MSTNYIVSYYIIETTKIFNRLEVHLVSISTETEKIRQKQKLVLI